MNILALICLVLALVAFAFFIFKAIKVSKVHTPGKYKIEGKERILFIGLDILTSVLLMLAALFNAMRRFALSGGETVEVIFGALIFAFALTSGLGAFILFYWKVDLDEKQRKICQFVWPIGLAVTILSLWLYTEGVALHLAYPLINRIDFKFGLTSPLNETSPIGIQFYGLLIITGALFCYAYTDHKTYQKFGKHGLIDTLFVIAFLAGIVGARLWSCYGLNAEMREYFVQNPQAVITEIGQGGLAIQGGLVLGIVVGVAYVLIFRKYIDVRFLMDVAIPTILIAQVLGRWGNFFNCEVHGEMVLASNYKWLPTIVRENLTFSSDLGFAQPGYIWQPLYMIEGLVNLAGYFFIRYFLGKVCKFGIGRGYQGAAYVSFYGLVRVLLENLRSERFRNKNSYIFGFVMLGAGVILFFVLFAIHKIRMSKGLEDKNGDKIKHATN